MMLRNHAFIFSAKAAVGKDSFRDWETSDILAWYRVWARDRHNFFFAYGSVLHSPGVSIEID
jgi:hypothetical protein